jgi:isoquinoline 1-oxidoreductase alpha subunit
VIELQINGQAVQVEDPATPLLWVIREQLKLTGTKFGCGVGMCGACTVHLNGSPMRTCVLPAAAAVGQAVTTIEGVDHVVQEAWIAHRVPQCGYCQSGQIMSAIGLLESNRDPSDADIATYMTNLCRCATYDRIRTAIKAAAQQMPAPPPLPEPEPEPPADEPVEGDPVPEGGE